MGELFGAAEVQSGALDAQHAPRASLQNGCLGDLRNHGIYHNYTPIVIAQALNDTVQRVFGI